MCGLLRSTPAHSVGDRGRRGTVATFVFAEVEFGVVVAAGALLAVWSQRRQRQPEACAPDTAAGPVDLELSAKRPVSGRQSTPGSAARFAVLMVLATAAFVFASA